MGDTKMVEGKVGEALEFDGDGDSVDCGNDTSLDITDEITIEAWVKLASTEWFYLLEKSYNGANRSNYVVRVATTYVGFHLYNGSAYFIDIDNTVATNIGQWHHVVATYDGAIAKAYLDGDKLSNTQSATGTIATSEHNLLIGRRIDEKFYFDGTIDEVRIYDRALSEAEVKKNFAALAVVSPTKKLALTWGEIKASK